MQLALGFADPQTVSRITAVTAIAKPPIGRGHDIGTQLGREISSRPSRLALAGYRLADVLNEIFSLEVKR